MSEDRCQHKQLGIQCVHKNGHEGGHEVATDDVMAVIQGGGIQDDEIRITKEDEHRNITVAQHKRWARRTLGDLNVLLQAFQKDMVAGQARQILVWNTINAVIRCFDKAGLINNEMLKLAGEELMAEARANMEATKKAIDEKRRVREDELVQTPLEEKRKIIYG